MYIRCPQNEPFLIPPATAKFAFAFRSDGDTIHPPPVTKSVEVASHAGREGGVAGQLMSACACATITSAIGGPPATGLLTMTCKALTSIAPDWSFIEGDCSLITTDPAFSGSWTVWPVAPEITTF